MGARCSVCDHPDRVKIEEAMRNGASVRGLAETYGIGKTSLYDHRNQHMTDVPIPFDEKSSLQRIAELEKISRAMTAKALNSGKDDGKAIQYVKTALDCIALSSRLKGELSGKGMGATGISTEAFGKFTNSLLSSLDNYPECKLIIEQAIEAMTDEDTIIGSPVNPEMG